MSDPWSLEELSREASMGAVGGEAPRAIPRIDLADFDSRRSLITQELWHAATDVGFFQLVNHGIPLDLVRSAFAASQSFFALPDATKERWPLDRSLNAGWESRSQVRPSTATADEKESFQITLPAMAGRWPTNAELPGFRSAMEAFELACWQLAMEVLSCFAERLGFDSDFFTRAHDPSSETYQSTLRLLHYPAGPEADPTGQPAWRAGAHTDFDCVTLLFQQAGQSGLQVCPGAERDSGMWTSVEPDPDVVTCNIGDMLMRWSDDQLQSTLHRVKAPGPDDAAVDRYSIAFFAQANREVVIAGPNGVHAPISAADYIAQRVAANY